MQISAMGSEMPKKPLFDEKKVAGAVLSSKPQTELVESLLSGTKRFSQLQAELNWTSGRLNYYILRMMASGILERLEAGYSLTEEGRAIARKYL